MKKSVKIALSLAAVLILLGSILSISVALAVGRNWDRLSTFISGEDYQRKEYVLPADQLSGLLVEETAEDIRITAAAGDEIRVSYAESDEESYEIELSPQGRLSIRKKEEQPWFRFSLNLGQKEGRELRISIPQELAGNLEILSASGDVRISELNTQGSLSIRTASGDMHLQNCKVQQKVNLSTASGELRLLGLEAQKGLAATSASGDLCLQSSKGIREECRLSTASGDILLEGSQFSGLLLLESASGEQQLENLQIEGDLQMESSSGELELEELQINGDLQLESTSGDMELEAVSAQNMNFHSVSGDISGTLLGDSADYSFNSRSTSGSIRLPSGNGSLYTVMVKTTSGDVHLQMQDW